MNKTISSKITALTFGILVVCFAVAFYVVAWQEPSQAPPGSNIATPLNVGPTGQAKEGGLILNTGGAPKGLIIDQGQVCIGTDCRDAWPSGGVIPSGMIAMFDTSCPAGWTRFTALDNRFPRGAATYGGTGGSSSHAHSYSGTTGPPSSSTRRGATMTSASPYHRHSYSGVTGSTGHLPPYLNVVWCKKD